MALDDNQRMLNNIARMVLTYWPDDNGKYTYVDPEQGVQFLLFELDDLRTRMDLYQVLRNGVKRIRYEPFNDLRVDERFKTAHDLLLALSAGTARWRMSIPVQQDDPDVVLFDAFLAQMKEINRLRDLLSEHGVRWDET